MKKIIYIIACACMMGFSSCADTFLDLEPLDSRTDQVYFKTPTHFREFSNGFYSQLFGWRSGITGHMDLQSDLVTSRNGEQSDIGYGALVVNDKDACWDIYNSIRTNNILLQRAESYAGDPREIQEYVSEAHFFRAYNYFSLLQHFGGVPIVLVPYDTGDSRLKAPRNSRYEVVDLILSDLDKAIAGLPIEQNIADADKGHISRQGAKAFKARVLLYEATWRKYNGTSTDFEGSSGPSRDQINEFLDEAIALAKSVMDDPAFRLWNYNGEDVMKNLSNRYLFCIESADSNPGKHGRDTNQEFILYSVFDKDANAGAIELNKNILPYIYPTRKFIDMFVCTNGLPIAGNEQFKGYHNMGDEFQNRDYRMNSYVGAPTTVIKLSGTIGFGGYGVQKFMCPGTKDKEESANYPVLRLAEVYLIYAEALMERHGSITDEELNVSINKLRGRAGVASLTNKQVADHQLDMLEEIRRERAVELFLEGFRYDDLKRWGVLESMLNQSRLGMVVGDPGYRTPYKDASGSVITDAYDNKSYRYGEEQTTTGDGELSCVLLAPKSNSHLRKAHYLYPIPQNQINLNPNLKQNPGYN